MPASNRIEHPVLDISIGGVDVERRPSVFSLITDQGFPSVAAFLKYPQGIEAGNAGDDVTVSLEYGSESYLLFTGKVCSSGVHGTFKEMRLTDGYRKLCDTNIVASYRKEKAPVILQDTLDASGIGDTSVTCPDVEIARFSTENVPAERHIKFLIKALEEHGHAGLRFFFDEKDVFHFGKNGDTGKNEGTVFEFESGANILKKGEGFIEVLPLPIRHSQRVKVDGVELETARTDLLLAGFRSRLKLWLKEAA